MGHELVGVVVDGGSETRLWKKGDQVISQFSLSCGKYKVGRVIADVRVLLLLRSFPYIPM